jgi:hypothetical protein
MITRGAVSASTPSPACHHDNTPDFADALVFSRTGKRHWRCGLAITSIRWRCTSKLLVEQTGSVGYAFARTLRGRH